MGKTLILVLCFRENCTLSRGTIFLVVVWFGPFPPFSPGCKLGRRQTRNKTEKERQFADRIAKTQYRKFETNFPRKGIAPASVPICIFMYLWAIYIFPWSVWLFRYRKICGPIHVDWGRAIPFLWLHKLNFPCSVTREGGKGRPWSRIIRPQESLALYKSFNPSWCQRYKLLA